MTTVVDMLSSFYRHLKDDLVPNTMHALVSFRRAVVFVVHEIFYRTKVAPGQMYGLMLRFIHVVVTINDEFWPELVRVLTLLKQREEYVVRQVAHNLEDVLEDRPREAIRLLRQHQWKSYAVPTTTLK
jgi:hypothetical protein